MMSVTTTITMDKKNIEKFIKLYGEGNGDFSLSLVIPEQSPTKKTVTAKKKSAAKKKASKTTKRASTTKKTAGKRTAGSTKTKKASGDKK